MKAILSCVTAVLLCAAVSAADVISPPEYAETVADDAAVGIGEMLDKSATASAADADKSPTDADSTDTDKSTTDADTTDTDSTDVDTTDASDASSDDASPVSAMLYAASKAAKEVLDSRGAVAYPDQDAELWIGERQYPGTVRMTDGTVFVGLGEFARFTDGGEYVCVAGEVVRVPADADDPDGAAVPGFAVTEARVGGGRYNIEACAGDEYVVSNGRYFWGEAESFADGTELFVPYKAAARAFGLTVDGDTKVTGGGDVTDGDDFYREDEVYWLSHIIEAESGCESLRGKIAVGSVVLNRVNDPTFPDTIWSVIWDHRFGVQFSPTESGTIWNEASEESVIAAKICLEGDRVSETVMYFVNPAIAESTWVQDNRPFEMTIGNHAFFG